MVVFALQSVIKDPPFTRLDLLCCRNLLIYLEPDLQDRLMPIFHYALKPGGVLCLSPSESIGSHHDLFDPIERKFNIYRAKPSLASRRALLSSRIAWTPENPAPELGVVGLRLREGSVAELACRALRSRLRRPRCSPKAIVDTVRDPLVVLDRQLRVVTANRAYTSRFGGPAAALLGLSFYAVGERQWDVAPMHELLDTVPPAERNFEARELTLVFPRLGPQHLRLSARRVTEQGGSTELVLLSIEVLPGSAPS